MNLNISRRRPRSLLTKEANLVNSDQTTPEITMKHSTRPPRPVCEGWATRLWDNMYGSKQQAPQKSNLRLSVECQLEEGNSYGKILKNVKSLLNHSCANKKVTPVQTYPSSRVLEFLSYKPDIEKEELNEDNEEVFYSAIDIELSSTRSTSTSTRSTSTSRRNDDKTSGAFGHQRFIQWISSVIPGLKIASASKKGSRDMKPFFRKSQSQRKQNKRFVWKTLIAF